MDDPIIKASLIIAGSLLIATIIVMYPTYKCISYFDDEAIVYCFGTK